MKRQMQKGFTLIELMIVVAIIAILAAIAIPAYSDYVLKAKTGSAIASLNGLKTSVSVCALDNGGVLTSCDTGSEGIPTWNATDVLATAVVTDGVIVATFGTGIGTGADSLPFKLEPTVGSSTLEWEGDVADATPITNTTVIAEIQKIK